MRRPKTEQHELIPKNAQVFRTHSYEAATLTQLAQATGLQKASLYHRFPGGKQEMALAVLDHTDAWFTQHIFTPLKSNSPPPQRLKQISKALTSFYANGSTPCLLDAFTLQSPNSPLAERIKTSTQLWLDAMAKLAKDSGHTPKSAQHRAEQALTAIQGALIVSRALQTPAPFNHAIKQLTKILLYPQQPL